MSSRKICVWVVCQTLVAVVALSAGAAAPADVSASAVPAGEKAWAIELRSSGGFTGRGNGSSSALSDGSVTVTSPYGATEPHAGRLDAEHLRDLGAAVWAANPARWSKKYGQVVPDGITLTLKLQRRETAGVVVYECDLSNDPEHLPSDLSKLLQVYDLAVKSIRSSPKSGE